MDNVPVMIVTDDVSTSNSIDISTDHVLLSTLSKSTNTNNKSVQQRQFLNAGAPSSTNSLLGADLLSLNNMPPPKLNVVKKSRVMVNPGKSMVEWMKIQQDQSTRVPVKLRKIGVDELAIHNQPGDVWMALNDRVYDVSDYVRYHPGGVEEIMKGAGQDATNMFNQIHRWVNFESILKTNLLGFLVRGSTLSLANILKSQASLTPNQFAPITKFSEDEESLFLEVDSDQEGEMGQECWTVGVLNRERFMLKVVVKPPNLWMTHLQLLKVLHDDEIHISYRDNFKRVLIKLKKPQKERWKALGAPLAENNKYQDSRGAIEDMYPAKLTKKQQLNHNVYLFTFQVAQSAIIGVPLGFHLRIRINGVCRKYTPASPQILQKCDLENSNIKTQSNQELYFIIKTYPDGELTRQLDQLRVNESLTKVEIGSPGGSFDIGFLHGVDTLCMLAAGSGITPFIRILQYLLQRRISVPVGRVILIFFNQSVEDIIWNEEWKKLAEMEPDWFHFYPVISNNGEEWKGLTGKISSELFTKCVSEVVSPTTITVNNKAIICGSYGFNDACKQAIRGQSVLKIDEPTGLYLFTG